MSRSKTKYIKLPQKKESDKIPVMPTVTCAECGKEFFRLDYTNYVYKTLEYMGNNRHETKYFCCYTCYRKWQKDHESKAEKAERARIQKELEGLGTIMTYDKEWDKNFMHKAWQNKIPLGKIAKRLGVTVTTVHNWRRFPNVHGEQLMGALEEIIKEKANANSN